MNRVLFEVSCIGNPYGLLTFIAILCGMLFMIGISIKRGYIRQAVFVSVILIIYIATRCKSYYNVVVQYKNGHYIEIEGEVWSYSLSGKKTTESFTVGGVVFRYSNGGSWGYCLLRRSGGVIAGNGQHLRIRYVPDGKENAIVYIEQIIEDT